MHIFLNNIFELEWTHRAHSQSTRYIHIIQLYTHYSSIGFLEN